MDKKTPKSSFVSFGIVADLQYCDGPPTYNRYYRKSPEKLKRAVNEFNNTELDFVINLGDTIDRDWQSFDGILPHFVDFKAPVRHVLGNHDFEIDEKYKPEVHKKLNTKKYYDFSIDKWRFIVLDGNDISTFANHEQTAEYEKAELLLKSLEKSGAINANFWNGGIGENQLKWMTQKLDDAEKDHQNVIIFCHFPAFPAHKHNLLNDVELLKTIKNYSCVKAWINGHNHDGNYGMNENTHFINVKGMVDTEFDTPFSILKLTDNNIKIEGFGTEISARFAI